MRLFTNSIVAVALLAAVSVRAADDKPAPNGRPVTQSEKKQEKKRPASKEVPPPKQGKQGSAVKSDRDGLKPAAQPCEEVKPCSIE